VKPLYLKIWLHYSKIPELPEVGNVSKKEYHKVYQYIMIRLVGSVYRPAAGQEQKMPNKAESVREMWKVLT
jgi:DNA topoisomerase IA